MANLIKVPTKLSSGEPKYLILSRSGYYSPPQDCLVTVHVIGGGGGGGGSTSIRGGGGGYAAKTLRLNAGAVYNVVIGAGGSGGSGNIAATAGGNTTFQGFGFAPIIGYGGGGGVSNPSPSSLSGGAGGKASGGDVNREGTHGYFRGKVDLYGKLYGGSTSASELDHYAITNNVIKTGIFGKSFDESPFYSAPSGAGGQAGLGSGSNGPKNGGSGVVIIEEH